MPECKHIPSSPRFKDLTGQRFWRLTVVGYLGRMHSSARWLCRCVCGKEVTVSSSHLKTGSSKSCGCLRAEQTASLNNSHGEARVRSRTKEYKTWCKIIERCENPKSIRWKHYGGRGIKICDQWRNNFETFLSDVGRAPSPFHSINRIDNNGHYEPGNVEWASREAQSRNRSNTVIVQVEGKYTALAELCEQKGINPRIVSQRMHRDGWSLEEAISIGTSQIGGRSRRKK